MRCVFYLRYALLEIDDCVSSKSGLNIPYAIDFKF